MGFFKSGFHCDHVSHVLIHCLLGLGEPSCVCRQLDRKTFACEALPSRQPTHETYWFTRLQELCRAL
jgi:hypothetical protein